MLTTLRTCRAPDPGPIAIAASPVVADGQFDVPACDHLIRHLIRQILEVLGYTLRTKKSPARDKFDVFTSSALYQ
jgi:hypothetical protein